MQTIGFATEFYTLWDVVVTPNYFTDSYGNHWLQSNTTNYIYIKNVSKDLSNVVAQYPDLSINEDLKGKTSSWSKKSEDLTPHILKFGKYSGRSVQEVSEMDFGYILWLIQNGRPETVKICKELPSVIAHLKNAENEKKQKAESFSSIESGVSEITFNANPNKQGHEIPFIRLNAQTLENIPATLNWEPVNEWASQMRKDWFILEKAMYEDREFRIMSYHDVNGAVTTPFYFNEQSFNSLEEAREGAEITKLSNQNKLDDYYVPTKYFSLLDKFYAPASIGEGNTIYIFFDQVKSVAGMYPYNMGVVGGKAIKTKNKTMKLDLNVFHTERSEFGVIQYATINN